MSNTDGEDDVANSYLDYNHPQRVNVRDLADATLPAQDLRCCPPYGIAFSDGSGRFQVRNDSGEAEVGETRAA